MSYEINNVPFIYATFQLKVILIQDFKNMRDHILGYSNTLCSKQFFYNMAGKSKTVN